MPNFALPRFEVLRPASLAEATQILESRHEAAIPICGGTELLLLFKLGLVHYDYLVDLKHLEELSRLERDGDVLVIGAGVTHRQLERSQLVRQVFPVLAEMERSVANVRVRSAGTVGGNISFADPHSDVLTLLAVTDTDVVIEGSGSKRSLELSQLVLGPYQTCLERGELLTSLRVPIPRPGLRFTHSKIAFHERPAVTVSCAVSAPDGMVDEVRLAVGSVGARVTRSPAAEAMLIGMDTERPDLSALQVAAAAAAQASEPQEDANGSCDYKMALVTTVVRRSLERALSHTAHDASGNGQV